MVFWITAIVVVALMAILYGFRRPRIAPLPGVRVAMSRPVVKESDLGPDSAYQLLMAAGEEPPGLKPSEGFDQVWPLGRSEALDKLDTQPWPKELPPPAAPAAPAPEWGGLDANRRSMNADAPWTRAQVLDIQRVLELYRPRFAMLDRALTASDPQMPTSEPDDLVWPEYHTPSQELSRALILSAHCQAAAGDVEGAYRDLLRSARLGNLMSRGGPVFHALVCSSLLCDSCGAARHIALRYEGSPDVLRRAARDYLACADAMEPMAETMRAGALFGREWIVHSYDSGFIELQYADDLSVRTDRWCPGRWTCWALARFGWLVGSTPTKTARTLDAFFQHLISLAEQPYSASVPADEDDLARRLAARGSMAKVLLGTWDPVGYLAAGSCFGALQNTLKRPVETRAQVRGTALLLAIKAHETEHGALPEQLAQLVPDYLPRVPKDPFDGKPFRYLRSNVPGLPAEAWAVYSIGEDFTDDGGTAQAVGSYRTDQSITPDLVWPSLDYPPLPPEP